jgi:hypothetical protein
MTHVTQSTAGELRNAEPGDEVFIDDKMPLTVKKNANGIHLWATRNGYDYMIEVVGQEVTVELMDTGRVQQSREIVTDCVSVLA